MENTDLIKESKILPSEEEIKKDLRETLKLSPVFELMTPSEQEKFVNEEYEKCRKYYKGKEEREKEK